MATIEKLNQDIQEIQRRNKRVEAEKAWETSWTRKVSIIVVTYILVSIVFAIINVDRPLVNAIIPTLGYFLSTLSLPILKKWWINKRIA